MQSIILIIACAKNGATLVVTHKQFDCAMFGCCTQGGAIFVFMPFMKMVPPGQRY